MSPVTREVDTWRTLPNLITALRILLIIPFTWYAVHGRDLYALVIFAIAGISDGVDGLLARRLNQFSRLGRLIDPLADKFLTGTGYIVLSVFRDGLPAIPLWVMAMVVGRDLLILLGAWIVYRSTRTTEFKPTIYGKLNTVIELVVIPWFLLTPPPQAVYFLMAISILISLVDYARQGIKMLK